jgi:poly(beta-D-mannuronate) lyase
VLENCNHPTDAGETRWISLYGRRNRVDHCSISGKTGKGTTLVAFLGEEPNEHRIDHNYFGPRKKVGKNGGETLRIGDSDTAHLSSKTIVEDNYFEECDGEAEIISNKSCDNVYRRNVFVRCSGALTLRHGHRCLVEANYFLGQRAAGTGGVRIIGEGHRVVNNYFSDLQGDDHRAALCMMNGIADSPANGYSPVKGAVVAFNTFINCKETIVVGLADGAKSTVPPADCTIANNLIVAKRPAVLFRSEPAGFRWAGNLVQGNVGATLEGVRAVEDLKLLHVGELWTLSSGSPAIDSAANALSDVAKDIRGVERDAHPDVGCEEFVKDEADGTLLNLDDVGASWAPKPRPAVQSPN